MSDLDNAIRTALRPLIGLKLSVARNAGNMKVLHFGDLRRTDKGLIGKYALHIQCPWRIERDGRIVTGWADYYIRADNNDDEEWEPGAVTGHLQNQIVADLLQEYDAETRSYTNQTDHFQVTEVSSDEFGGVQIHMTGNYQIVLFPCASRSEAWRLLEPGSETPHFVVEAGIARLE